MSERVLIFDTTLRDGEQSPGIALNTKEKLEIAEQLARLGVDVIEAGFPRTSQGDFDAVRAISAAVHGPTIAALARTDKGDIDRAWEAIAGAGRPRLHVFISTSQLHREHMLRASEAEVLEQAVAMVAYAKSLCEDVEFSAQDATRTDPEFLFQVIGAAVASGATTINIPDTVGYAIPHDFGALIRAAFEAVPRLAEVTVSVHCHDDLGLSVANSLEAVRNGVRQVEVAVNGIGERAGNCSLEEVVMALKTRHDLFGLEVGINTREIARTSRMVALLTGYPVPPNKAVVGANAFAHEAGIHQHGVLIERQTYEIMSAEDVGVEGSRIVLGKHSGRHAFSKALQDMGFELSKDDMAKAFARFKELADRKLSLTDMDLEAIVTDEMQAFEEAYRLEGIQVAGGTHLSPTATVRLSHSGKTLDESALGDGMVDAACQAISRATGVDARLVHFQVASITGGTDALGDVTIQVEVEGRRFTGRGVASDIVEASARAFMQAVNKSVRASAVSSGTAPDGPAGGV
ncbi:MAG: 2-isopropylmalate synthase [Actinomycetota bacterium]